jgi:hypothetical protein
MSKNFLFFLKNMITVDIKVKNSSKIKVGVTGTIIFVHGFYAYLTKEEKQIFVKSKYTFTRNGYEEFMIIDNNGKHYNVNNSFWYWKFNSIEDWNNIETNKHMYIQYYGWRVPIFGMFPNIIHSHNNDFSSSSSSSSTYYLDETNIMNKH